MSDETAEENYIYNLLTLVIWKCLLCILSNCINIFFNKVVLRRGAQCFQGWAKSAPSPPLPYTNVLVRIWLCGIILAFSLFSIHTQELKLFSVELVSGDVKKVNGTVLNKVLALGLRTELAWTGLNVTNDANRTK